MKAPDLEDRRWMLVDEARRVQQATNRLERDKRRKTDPDRVDPSNAEQAKRCRCIREDPRQKTWLPAEDGLPRRCFRCGKRI